MEKSIKDFKDTELKAINWDNMVKIEELQGIMKIINSELASRAKNTQNINKMPEDTNVTPEVIEEVVENTPEVVEEVVSEEIA
jgi:hypothetical protein